MKLFFIRTLIISVFGLFIILFWMLTDITINGNRTQPRYVEIITNLDILLAFASAIGWGITELGKDLWNVFKGR